MEVSWNEDTPKSFTFNKVFHEKNHQLLESAPGPWKPPDVAAGVAAPLEAFPLGDCGLQPAGDAGDGPAQGGAAGGGSRNGFVMISMYHSI